MKNNIKIYHSKALDRINSQLEDLFYQKHIERQEIKRQKQALQGNYHNYGNGLLRVIKISDNASLQARSQGQTYNTINRIELDIKKDILK